MQSRRPRRFALVAAAVAWVALLAPRSARAEPVELEDIHEWSADCVVSGTVIGKGFPKSSGSTKIVKGGARFESLTYFIQSGSAPKTDLTFSRCSPSQEKSIRDCRATLSIQGDEYGAAFASCTQGQTEFIRNELRQLSPAAWRSAIPSGATIILVNAPAR